MQRVLFEPVDSLFFRDGRPYNMDDPGLGQISTTFPPNGRTLVGALRAALARALGWNERHGPWSQEVCEQLGSGEDLGPLQFRGPFLLHRETLLFQVPAHILGRRKEASPDDEHSRWHLVALAPGSSTDSDLGSGVRLPSVGPGQVTEGAKPLLAEGLWVTAQGLAAILAGGLPCSEDLIPQQQLWTVESRTGIQRDPDTRTALEGFLYTASHVRLMEGVRLALDVDNLPQGEVISLLQSRVHPVGGEARMCSLRLEDFHDAGSDLPDAPNLVIEAGRVHYTVILLQPADLCGPPQPGKGYARLPGRIVSACLPKPIVWGGWNSVGRHPRPLRPHLAPGSILFLEAEEREYEQVTSMHGKAIGANTEWGFGLIAVGCWPPS